MPELTCTVPTFSTVQELERAIQQYIASDLSDPELLCQWQAIRDASLNLQVSKPKDDNVPGEDSY